MHAKAAIVLLKLHPPSVTKCIKTMELPLGNVKKVSTVFGAHLHVVPGPADELPEWESQASKQLTRLQTTRAEGMLVANMVAFNNKEDELLLKVVDEFGKAERVKPIPVHTHINPQLLRFCDMAKNRQKFR